MLPGDPRSAEDDVRAVLRVVAVLAVMAWTLAASVVGTGVFESTYCFGDSGEPFWLDWAGGRRVCGVEGPALYEGAMWGSLLLALAVLVLARRHTDRRFWVRCGIAALLPLAAYGVLRVTVAVG
jgi:hypothetical protein